MFRAEEDALDLPQITKELSDLGGSFGPSNDDNSKLSNLLLELDKAYSHTHIWVVATMKLWFTRHYNICIGCSVVFGSVVAIGIWMLQRCG